MKKSNNKKGFTIIELIVVMAIIGVLVLLAVPKFGDHIKEAKFTKFISNSKQLENASERYYMDNDSKWPKTGVAYTDEQVTAFAQKIYDATGKTVTLEDGNYYNIDYDALKTYVNIPKNDEVDYIIQNPVGMFMLWKG